MTAAAVPEWRPLLTNREWVIAELVATGLSDKEIAAKLVVSVRTVNAHLHNVFLKTGIRSRSVLAIEYLCGNITAESETCMQNEATPVPVRLTVDLTPELHRILSRWAMRSAEELQVPRVALTDALRAMIRVTAEDPLVSGAVLAELNRVLPMGGDR